jgi:hypothetical protein
MIKILLILAVSCWAIPSLADDCDNWFKATGIKVSTKECLLDCAVAPIGMGDFTCRNRCDEFCAVSQGTTTLFKLSDLYPGLTAAERALAAEEPAKTLVAYQLSLKAEKLCQTIYKSSQTNDGSDACRLFIWAGLLADKLGEKFALNLLNAHEQDSLQPKEEHAMDTANNRLGIIRSGHLIKEKKFSEQELLKSFKEALKKSEIIILRNGT